MPITKTTTTLSTLKINYLTDEQYEEAVQGGTINENELYLTPGNSGSGSEEIIANGETQFDAPAILIPTLLYSRSTGEIDLGGIRYYMDLYYATQGSTDYRYCVDIAGPVLYSTGEQQSPIKLQRSVESINLSDLNINLSTGVSAGDNVCISCRLLTYGGVNMFVPDISMYGVQEVPLFTDVSTRLFYYIGWYEGDDVVTISPTGTWSYYDTASGSLVPFSYTSDWALLSNSTINTWTNLLGS